MRRISRVFLLCLPFVLLACSKDDNNSSNDNTPPPPPVVVTGPGLLGLEDATLLQFKAGAPGTIISEKALNGYTGQGGSSPPFPIGMDFRPANGALYVLFSDNNLYTVNTTSGQLHLEGQLAVG